MKHLLIILILTATCIAAPKMTYDPNSVIVSPDDANCMRYIVTIDIPKDQHRAMLYLNLSILDIIQQSRFGRLFDGLIEKARMKLIRSYTFDDAKAKLER